ncbi:NADH:flavin oxidoreductase [Asticcacaulis sp. YBE204]|uniref:NADH:flavin oxidoreductase n=1 Tax=Asticcacaulis sp. YBE204 TaxID=1282363 RepID=UPI0003C3D485|nr:NADH:flavin oxidoreductase [Asticcacaulis sp. YBE204]ESQ79937.1 12-oxophytodienoate reductase [Asticcacaulis sp. YBE204]
MSLNTLLSPYALKSLNLPNRVVMAPMTRQFSPGGVPTDDVARYYERRAEDGIGLILTEGTVIERPASKNEPNIPNFFGDALPAWGKVVEAVHAKGGRIAPQLWHTGAAASNTGYDPTPKDTPSGLTLTGEKQWEPMTDAAIADSIAAFGRAAGDAKRLGFDAIELHGAHGYLIDEFFWDQTNRRGDQWGGPTIGERTKFAAEVIKAARAEVGPDYPIIIRISQFKGGVYDARVVTTEADLEAWVRPLLDAGADIIHASQRRFWEPEFEGSDLNFAGWVKKLTGAPVITVGSVGLSGDFIGAFGGEHSSPQGIEELLRRLDRGDFDLVAVGRAILGDPAWLTKISAGRHEELKPFDRSALATLV